MGRLLVLEDNSVLGLDIEAQATKLGLDVTLTKDPQFAVLVARRTSFTAALIDINLCGGFEGVDVARVLNNETSAEVAFVTAYSCDDLAGRTTGVEHIPIFFKPMDNEALLSLLRRFAGVAPDQSDAQIPRC